jgi:hypothetical protein
MGTAEAAMTGEGPEFESKTAVPTNRATTLAAAIPATPTNQELLRFRLAGKAETAAIESWSVPVGCFGADVVLAYGFGSALSAASSRV